MASTTSSPTSGFFSSPRAQKALYWISGIVFAAGVIAVIAVYATRGNSKSTVGNPPSNHPTAPAPTHVKASSDALGVARRFLETAVIRKNVAASYDLVGPNLRTGFTRKQWATGNNTVVPYPATNAKTTALVVTYSHPSDLLLTVALVPKLAAGVKPQEFNLDINKINGRWLVNSFTPVYHHGVHPAG
ncbi:MAG TPA: hypothetical protein VHS03_12935 [Gaiellaceae bacterium]|jgi:hypothetical protein|nr:hypothetical protein [Gaiellaceae bacterium]